MFGGSKIVRLLPKIWLFLGKKYCAPFCALFGQIRCAFEFRIINHSAYDLILHFWGLYNFNLYLPNCPTWNEHFLHCQPFYFPLTFLEKKDWGNIRCVTGCFSYRNIYTYLENFCSPLLLLCLYVQSEFL